MSEEQNKYTLNMKVGEPTMAHFLTEKEKQVEALKIRIERDFTYHAPKPGQQERYVALRDKAKELALLIVNLTPPSREQSLALTYLEQASMMSNAAIARNE
jgi:hypothetical protein